ncbi:hypothetical protein KA344_02400, partial [bacterium]|nr:hypothetical protein [bacterium]
FVPSEKFLRNLELAVESLDPFEIAHLEKHSIRVQGLRRISDLREFRKVFDSDLLMLTRDRLRELRLDIEPGEVTSARDEVFADLYAHSTGLNARNQYSQKMKVAFPNCLRYIKEGVFK